MNYLDFRYKQGNATLDDILGLAVAINRLYSICKETESFDGIDDFGPLLATAQNVVNRDYLNFDNLRKGHYILVRLIQSDEDSRSLTLDRHLRNPDGTMYEGKDGLRHRCAVSVGKEAERLIQKYGAKSLDELRERFHKEFQSVINEDYGLYEDLMFEFFLKNLHFMVSH